MSAVAKAAQVSIGGLYGRFGSRELLLWRLFRDYESDRTRTLVEAWAEERWHGVGLEGRARGICEAIVSLMRSRRGLLRAFLLHYWASRDRRDPKFDQRLGASYAAAEALLLAAPDERPADVDASIAIAIVAGACRDIVVVKPKDAPGALPLDDDRLVDALCLAMLAILRRGNSK